MAIPQNVADTIVDAAAYADGDRIDEAYSWLRREAPLAKILAQGHDPFWAVTRHADILSVERQNDLFSSSEKYVTLITTEARIKQEQGGGVPVRTLVQMDGPEHFAYRRLTQSWFMPPNLRTLETRIREIARTLIDRMAAHGGRCDFARDIALLYPLHVIMEILGVPAADEPRMLKLTQELFGASDPDHNRSGKSSENPEFANEEMQKAIFDFAVYFNAITEDRRKNPRTDLASVIANSRIDGVPIGAPEAIGYYIITATAGHDTTSATMAGAMWALAEHPEQFRRLKENPLLIPGHVEEAIRWVTAVKHFMRTATEDAVMAGQKIAKGDWIMLCYLSGNRDEAVFDNPFAYNIERAANRQLAFGYGAHMCLGQHLARLEMRLFWEELLPRLESVELDGAPTRVKSNFVGGPKSVPIRFRMQ